MTKFGNSKKHIRVIWCYVRGKSIFHLMILMLRSRDQWVYFFWWTQESMTFDDFWILLVIWVWCWVKQNQFAPKISHKIHWWRMVAEPLPFAKKGYRMLQVASNFTNSTHMGGVLEMIPKSPLASICFNTKNIWLDETETETHWMLGFSHMV